MSQVVAAVPPIPADMARRCVSVLVVHPEEVVRCGWRLLLSRQEWAERCLDAADELAATDLAGRYGPNVAVLDLDVGQDACMRLAGALREANPQVRILLLAGRTTISAKAAQFLGATGVVQKVLPAADLVNAVLAVASGVRVYAAPAPQGAGRLSAREHEVLQLLSDGATNAEIAAHLHLSRETIKQHAAAVYRKLGVRNRTEAAQRGKQLGLELGIPA